MFSLFSENYKHKRRKRDIRSSSLEDTANSDISDINKPSTYNNLNSFSTLTTSPHSRRKRSVSYKNYVEVLVAADHLMLRYHKDDLQNYILNLMAIVSSTFVFIGMQ